jgi:hypothetical protein
VLNQGVAKGLKLSGKKVMSYRLRFAEAPPRTAETRLIFRLAAKPCGF